MTTGEHAEIGEQAKIQRRSYTKEKEKGVGNMGRSSSIRTTLAVVLVFAISALVFAQESSRHVTLHRDGKIGDQVLRKGDYTVKVGEAKDGEIVFIRDRQEVLRASFEPTDLEKPASNTAVLFATKADGSFEIKRIEFSGKKVAFVIKGVMQASAKQ
jgi:hypothetical protein